MTAAVVPLEPHRRTRWNAADLLRAEFPPARWAVDGVVPEGVNLLVGAPKVGKSWLAFSLAVEISMGGSAFGSIPVHQGPVLYCALEDTPRRLQRRLSLLLDGGDGRRALELWTDLDSTKQIDEWCTATPDARLVVVDVLARVRPSGEGASSNRYDQDYAVIGGLKSIADRHGLSILVLHHDRKAGADDFVDSVSGTHGLAGAADGILALTRSRTAADAVLRVTGRDVEEAEYAMNFDASRGLWTMLDRPPSELQLSDQRRNVLDLVRAEISVTPKTLADSLRLSPANARQLLKRMCDKGQLDTDGSGHYFDPSLPLSHQ